MSVFYEQKQRKRTSLLYEVRFCIKKIKKLTKLEKICILRKDVEWKRRVHVVLP